MMYFQSLLSMVEFSSMDKSIVGGLIGAGATFVVGLIGYLVFFGRKFEKIDKLEKEQDKQEEKIDDFSTDIATLKEFKANTEKIIDQQIYKSKSPISLTDFGKQL